ncbi:MAG: hypothetical protein WCX85_03495 [Bacilli bacterium]|jgi:hypothetical protein|nr:hypothetical protein [Bacilli bacterium]
MSAMTSADRKLRKAVMAGFEIQAAEFQCLENKYFFYKKFYGIFDAETNQIRFRAESKVEEREVYINISDKNDQRKYVITHIEKNDVTDYLVKVRDQEYSVKCFLANVQVI